MQTNPNINLTMLCDFYELTMANGYFKSGMQDKITYFDLFFRKVPDEGGFSIAAGLEQAIEYIQNLHFGEDDIAYLRTRGIFGEDFLDYLKSFRFTGDIWAVPEGTPIFPKEPILTVRAPAIEAQLLETFALLTINHQSLIATKANRIVRAARGHAVMEFGSRRAQGSAAAIDGATAWEAFWKITLPHLRPIILLNAIYTIIEMGTAADDATNGKIVGAIRDIARPYSYAAVLSWIYAFGLLLLILLAFLLLRPRRGSST